MRHLARFMLATTLTMGLVSALSPQTIALTSVSCQEDQACWDCATMGNGICGLTPTEDAAELAESTVHNGQELPSTY